MSMFRTSAHRLRQIVWLTLMAWLLALSAGVVNACMLGLPDAAVSGVEPGDRRMPAWHGSSAHLPKPEALVEFHEHGTTAHGQDDHGQDTGKDPCRKFCSDESTALPKAKSCDSDLIVVPVAEAAWHFASAATMNVSRGLIQERPTSRGTPLFIRFLRLTL